MKRSIVSLIAIVVLGLVACTETQTDGGPPPPEALQEWPEVSDDVGAPEAAPGVVALDTDESLEPQGGCSMAQIHTAQAACRTSCSEYACSSCTGASAGEWCCSAHHGIDYCDPSNPILYTCARTASACPGGG